MLILLLLVSVASAQVNPLVAASDKVPCDEEEKVGNNKQIGTIIVLWEMSETVEYLLREANFNIRFD